MIRRGGGHFFRGVECGGRLVADAADSSRAFTITPTRPASDLRFMGRYRGDDGQHFADGRRDRLDHHRLWVLERESQPDHAIGGSPIAVGHEDGGPVRSHDQHADHGRLRVDRPVWSCAVSGIRSRPISSIRIWPICISASDSKGLVVAGILAAAISTFDSMGSSLSALFTRDIYARLIATDRDDAHYVRVSRWATMVILALGFAYVPFIGTKETMLQAFLTLIPVFVTPLFTIYLIGIFTRAHAKAGIMGILDRRMLWRHRPGRPRSRRSRLARSLVYQSLVSAPVGDGVHWIWVRPARPLCSAAVVTKTCRHQQAGWLQESSRSLATLPEHPFDRPPSRWLSSGDSGNRFDRVDSFRPLQVLLVRKGLKSMSTASRNRISLRKTDLAGNQRRDRAGQGLHRALRCGRAARTAFAAGRRSGLPDRHRPGSGPTDSRTRCWCCRSWPTATPAT